MEGFLLMDKEKAFLGKSEGDTSDLSNENKNSDESTSKSFFCNEEVVKGGSKDIEIRFKTLIYSHCEKPSDWYRDLGIDKSNASKIRRGLFIPSKWLKIKIAQHFKTDSATIWGDSDE